MKMRHEGPQHQYVFYGSDNEVARYYKFDGRDAYQVFDGNDRGIDTLYLTDYRYQTALNGPDKTPYPFEYADEMVREHASKEIYWDALRMTRASKKEDRAAARAESIRRMEEQEDD